LLFGGEGACRAERILLAAIRVDRRRRPGEPDERHCIRQGIAFRRHLPHVESVLFEVVDPVRELGLGRCRPAAGRDEENEDKRRAHGPTHTERGTCRGQEV
jgi:hypothetical protein